LVRRAFSIAQYLDSFINGRGRRSEADAKVLDVKSAEWVMEFNIGDIMTLKAISLQDLTKTQTTLAEMTTDSMLDKARTRQGLLMITSYFCIATELRFKFSQDKLFKKLKEGQAWHLQSINIAKDLLPKDSALLEHLKESYSRNYLDVLSAVGFT
jgi:hypothetical protein